MQVEIGAHLGALVGGFRIQDATPEQARRLLDLVYRHRLVVLQGQQFDEAEYVAFSRLLGRPQIYLQANYHHPDHPEIFVSSSVMRDGRKFGVKGTGRYWHTDYAFMPEPLPLTMVTPRIIPKVSRGTLYIDMVNVYESLPSHLRSFVDRHIAIHEGKWRYKVQPSDIDRSLFELVKECERLAPAVEHPAVIEHPVTGLRALYVSSGFTTGFKGVPHEEAQNFLTEINAFVERDEHVQQKAWVEHEILLWDNRVLIHKAAHADVDEANLSYRIGIYDQFDFYVKPKPKAHHAA